MTDLAHRARLARRRLREHASLRERVRVLEEEVQENRQLNRRIAELTDVVAELLIPLEARDSARVDEVLERFRAGL
ncbi:DUF6752 domain-containing protein [Nocardioides nitrophenolicus]|uniref:DUF6752 domain-containing protein n=1 Tax=Nocardioides nitrophenolicus TaxID=60489 RepID=UPI00195DC44B|nr:DUF6752 domain-containing protein [Nocardioides nitrophenolicus]MBM7519733.1 phosphoglycerate-specific signal transduction histidine kinase [Nocardioides nitrophenolicus]